MTLKWPQESPLKPMDYRMKEAFVTKWLTSQGVDNKAGTLEQLKVKDQNNVTIDELNANLDYFKRYEEGLVNATVQNASLNIVDPLIKLLENETAWLEMLENGGNPLGRRMLTVSDVIVQALPSGVTTPPNGKSVDAVAQVEESTIEAEVTDIPEKIPEEIEKAVDEIPDKDQGEVSEEDPSGSSGRGAMFWVMVIGGIMLVLALCAGGAYFYKQQKDAQGFQDDQMMTNA